MEEEPELIMRQVQVHVSCLSDFFFISEPGTGSGQPLRTEGARGACLTAPEFLSP